MRFMIWVFMLMMCQTAQAKYIKKASSFVEEQAHFGCVSEEANHWQIPLDIFLAINSIERGRNKPVGNTNGSQDLGVFQINTIHLDEIYSVFGATKHDLLYKGCLNAHVAGWLLDRAIHHPKKQHLDYYTRVAGYHSWTPKYNAIYRKKLVKYHGEWQAWLSKNAVQAPQAPQQQQAQNQTVVINNNPNIIPYRAY